MSPETSSVATGRKKVSRARKGPAVKKRTTSRLQEPPEADAAAIAPTDAHELRRRWENARTVIREAVGRAEDHDPRIWERGVYQLWLWLVVERLVVRRDELDVSELSVISKMLHDQRKLSLDEAKQQAKSHDEQGNGAAPSARLPEHFGEIVRQIYGTNFQDSEPT
ncbi:MAG: hypothetical protein GY778_16905 [bacterium]|nr:hypothetical protein [bacterium]